MDATPRAEGDGGAGGAVQLSEEVVDAAAVFTETARGSASELSNKARFPTTNQDRERRSTRPPRD
jgi:hypothetical protein